MEAKTETRSAQSDSNLTHKQAKLVLERLNPNISSEKFSDQDQEAINHYLPVMRGAGVTQGYDYLCKQCYQAGIADLIDLHLDCKKAIEEFARMLPLTKTELSVFGGRFWPGHKAATLRQLVAIEHIWGRPPYYQDSNPHHPATKACNAKVCTNVEKGCQNVHAGTNSSSRGQILTRLIDLFDYESWAKDKLFAQQKKRVEKITKKIVTVSEKKELMHYISNLQSRV